MNPEFSPLNIIETLEDVNFTLSFWQADSTLRPTIAKELWRIKNPSKLTQYFSFFKKILNTSEDEDEKRMVIEAIGNLGAGVNNVEIDTLDFLFDHATEFEPTKIAQAIRSKNFRLSLYLKQNPENNEVINVLKQSANRLIEIIKKSSDDTLRIELVKGIWRCVVDKESQEEIAEGLLSEINAHKEKNDYDIKPAVWELSAVVKPDNEAYQRLLVEQIENIDYDNVELLDVKSLNNYILCIGWCGDTRFLGLLDKLRNAKIYNNDMNFKANVDWAQAQIEKRRDVEK